MASSKNAPSFNPEADDYASWKSDVEVWRLLTEIKPEKIGPAVYLALQGKARDIDDCRWHCKEMPGISMTR